MASRANQTHPPLSAALRIIPVLPPRLPARFVARAIERLDELGGDPDLEDATCAEDEGLTPMAIRFASDGAGCEISDPGGGNVDDQGELQDDWRWPVYGLDQSLGPVNI